MKLFFILVLSVALISACQQPTKLESHKKMSTQVEQILNLNNHGSISSLHPHTGIDLQCRIFQKALFEGLTRISSQGEPELAAAQKIEVSDCRTKYTFVIRPSKWTNGESVTAYNFEKAWKLALSPDSNCLRSDLFYPIKNAEKAKKGEVSLDRVGILAKDAQTLIVELEHPTPYFLDLVANPIFSPLYDRSEMPSQFNGPFKLAYLELGNRMVLTKNNLYWDALQVQLEKINVSFVPDANTALILYEKGAIDWVGHPFTSLPLDAIEVLESHPDFHAYPISAVYWICLNTKRFPLNSTKIRQALSIALNRQELSRHVLLGETPSKSMLPANFALNNDEELYQDQAIDKAKELFHQGLAELHLSIEEFPALIYSHSDIPGQKKLAEAIQRCWSDTFGIQVLLQNSEWNVFFAKLGERDFQIGGCIWFSVYSDPSYNLEFFKHKNHRYNSPQWENSHYQKLLELADQEVDPSIRNEHLKQAEKLILDEMPIIPLYVFNTKYLKSQKIQGIYVSGLGQVDFKYAYIDENALQLTH